MSRINIDNCIGRSAGSYDKELSVIGDSTKVVLQRIDKIHNERFAGGIYIPESMELNNRLSLYTVIDCSTTCTDDYGIVRGDVVLADRLACYYDTDPIQVMDYNNIICKSIDGEPKPLNGMIFVKKMHKTVVSVKGIILSETSSLQIPIGVVSNTTTDEFPIGTYILMTTGADNITIGGIEYSIYKDEMILGVVSDIDIDEYKSIN